MARPLPNGSVCQAQILWSFIVSGAISTVVFTGRRDCQCRTLKAFLLLETPGEHPS
jgi:hypothetical protein